MATCYIQANVTEAMLQSAQPDLDFCLLNVPGLGAPSATLSSALNAKTGQRVYAVGMSADRNPLQPSLSKGVISSLRPYLRSQYHAHLRAGTLSL